MTDLDPEIWNNETLGAAAHNENLERLEKQVHEDRAAKLEGREPREVVVDRTYPGWAPEVQARTGTVPSNYQSVHFADEQQNDIPAESGPNDETAVGVAEENDPDSDGETGTSPEEPIVTDPESGEVLTASDETESDSEQWS